MQRPPAYPPLDLPPTSNPRDEEVASRVTLIDFFQTWYRFRVWFLIGFAVVVVGAFFWTKFVMPKFYRAEVRFFLGQKFTPESMIGLADIKVFQGSRNDQFQTVVLSNLSEQLLLSSDLITTVSWRLQHDPEPGQEPLDVYQLLGIEDDDPVVRDFTLVKIMRENLLQVRLSGTTGIIFYHVEMPSPAAATRYANASVRRLQEAIINQDFAYWEKALQLYIGKLDDQLLQRAAWSNRLRDLNAKSFYDRYEPIEQERLALQELLTVQAEQIALMNTQIELLTLATDPEAKLAAQPVKVFDWADPPIKKSRPKTILSTMLAAGLYTFVFMLGLVIVGFFTDQARRR